MEVLGTIKHIFDTEVVGTNGFEKRDVVITTDEQYPQHLSIQFVQNKCAVLDHYDIGDEVKVSINLRGREWVNNDGETKYFNTIQGWKIEKTGQAQPQQQEQYNPPPPANNSDDDDDLPF